MLISVVVGATRAGALSLLANTIFQQQYGLWELIIVTQGSDVALLNEAQQLAREDWRVRTTHLEGYGKSRALNAGVEAAQGDVIALTDDDCEADAQWLSTISDCFRAEPEVGIVAGEVIAPQANRYPISSCPSAQVLEYIYRPSANDFRAPAGFYFIGANYALRRSALERIGPFDEYFGPGGLFPAAEETDLGLRAEALDIAMWTTPRAVIYHTFGRRYGLRPLLKHHHNYARAKGALIGKLELWGHRLAAEWSREPSSREKLLGLTTKPSRTLLNHYLAKTVARAKQEYLANFTLGPNQLSIPKEPSSIADEPKYAGA